MSLNTLFVQTIAPSLGVLGLVIFVITIITSAVLALAVYRSNPKSATNTIFVYLSLVTMLWLFSGYYLVKVPELASQALLFVRLAIFFAAPMSALFFLLAHTLPYEKLRLSKDTFRLVLLVTGIMMVINISPHAFVDVEIINGTVNPKPGLGIIPFAVISTLFSLLAVYFLGKRLKKAKGRERQQLRLVLIGILLMLTLITVTILIPIVFFKSGLFVPFLPSYTLLFLGITAYAIVKHHLFNIKIIVAQAVTFIIWAVLFAKIFVSQTSTGVIVDTLVFLAVVVFGIFLIKSVKQEMEQREQIEVLAQKLRIANKHLKELDQRKSEFVSIASHQLRTPLTAIKGYTSMILEGSFGEISSRLREPINRVFQSSNRLVAIVEDFLTISRIEQNRLKYSFEDTNLKTLIEGIVSEMKSTADKKGLALSFTSKEGDYWINIDRGKISQVVSNLINNSLQYTPKGSIEVNLEKSADSKTFIFSVKDSGIGMTQETIDKIFQKFSRAEDASKTSTTGTGLGLYVASRLVKAHKGRIWAESQGKGQGSTFSVELPLAK